MKKPIPAAFKAYQFKAGGNPVAPAPVAKAMPVAAAKAVPLKTSVAGPKAVAFAMPKRAFPMDAMHAGNAEKRSK